MDLPDFITVPLVAQAVVKTAMMTTYLMSLVTGP
jgi:hypothetical protein